MDDGDAAANESVGNADDTPHRQSIQSFSIGMVGLDDANDVSLSSDMLPAPPGAVAAGAGR